jgi:hypothetical protein
VRTTYIVALVLPRDRVAARRDSRWIWAGAEHEGIVSSVDGLDHLVEVGISGIAKVERDAAVEPDDKGRVRD